MIEHGSYIYWNQIIQTSKMKKEKVSKLLFSKNSKNQWSWRLISPNGKKIAWSGEEYLTRAGCKKGWQALFAAVESGRYKVEGA